MALELAGLEAVLERPAPQRVGVAQGDQAAAQVAGGRDPEGVPQPAARAAVVGHRDDGGDVPGVAAHGPQGGGQAVAAAEGDDARPPGIFPGRVAELAGSPLDVPMVDHGL